MSRLLPAIAPPGGASGPLYGKGWDRLALRGEVMPGRWRVTRGSVQLRFDPKKANGSDGGKPSTTGIDPKDIEVEGVVWTEEQIALLESILQRILPREGQDPAARKPVLFEHASMRIYGNVFVLVTGGSPLMLAPEYGVSGRKVTITMHHWIAPKGKGKKATKTPKAPEVRNLQQEDAGRRKPPNPSPTKAPGIGGPGALADADLDRLIQ